MRVQDDGGVRGDTRHEAEADPSGERQASTVQYVPVMTSELRAARGVPDGTPLRAEGGGGPGLVTVLAPGAVPSGCAATDPRPRARPTVAA